MTTVEIVDRSAMINKLNATILLDPKETAIVTVDMHRGHLDPTVATMPTSAHDAARVILQRQRVAQYRASNGDADHSRYFADASSA